MYLGFGMPVTGTDGVEAGTLERVLVDPARREITHIVVRAPQVADPVLLPLSLVQGSTEDRLLLHAASGDLRALPRYYPGPETTPPSGRVDPSAVPQPPERQQSLEEALSVPPRTLELGPETTVSAAGERAGSLVGLGADIYVNTIAELRVRGLHEQDTVIAGDRIEQVRPGAIVLRADDA
jgi:hypothetical protein